MGICVPRCTCGSHRTNGKNCFLLPPCGAQQVQAVRLSWQAPLFPKLPGQPCVCVCVREGEREREREREREKEREREREKYVFVCVCVCLFIHKDIFYSTLFCF